jgi:L-fuculose-phosphate aldolase
MPVMKLYLNAVGVVHSELTTTQHAPRGGQLARQEATLEIFPQYCLALAGIERLSRILVLYWLHQSDREVLRVYPGGDRNKEMIGVFTNRSPLRPNPVAVSEVEILSVDICQVRVRGLDAIDGTSIIDLKAPETALPLS